MGCTHHNRNLSFKHSGEFSGFPGRSYQPLCRTLVESFHPQRLAEQKRSCICLFVAWVAPAGIKPIIIVLLFKLRSVYTLLSRATTANQLRNIRRVECTERLTVGRSPGFLWMWVRLHLLLPLLSLVFRGRMNLLAGLIYLQPCAHTTHSTCIIFHWTSCTAQWHSYIWFEVHRETTEILYV